MVTWYTIISLSLIFLGPMINGEHKGNGKVIREIPVMNVNIYVMGRNGIDNYTKELIDKNINYLNQEFEGHIEFNLNGLYSSKGQALLPDLFDDFHYNNQKKIDSLIQTIEVKGSINVYLFDTYPHSDSEVSLMGFSPRLVSGFEAYAAISPQFDRIFMSYEGLNDQSTLVHEMGHFFGLSHPWEMSDSRLIEHGILDDLDASENHMSYGPKVHEFTIEQLISMRNYVLNYRKYLTLEILKIYERV